jgi:hypothetical protein
MWPAQTWLGALTPRESQRTAWLARLHIVGDWKLHESWLWGLQAAKGRKSQLGLRPSLLWASHEDLAGLGNGSREECVQDGQPESEES